MSDVDAAIRRLRETPPKEFVRARTALAATLTAGGQRADAARVKKLRPAPVTAWVANRLAGEAPASIGRLVAASDQLRAAQLGRSRAGEAIGASAGEHGRVLRDLIARAEGLFREAGVKPTQQLRLRLQTTLAAAAADPNHRKALQAGELEDELGAQGFDVFAGARLPPRTEERGDETAPAAPSAEVTPKASIPATARKIERQREQEEARARAEAERKARRDRLAREVEDLAQAAEAAARKLEAARDEARRAALAVDAAAAAAQAADRALAAAKRRRP